MEGESGGGEVGNVIVLSLCHSEESGFSVEVAQPALGYSLCLGCCTSVAVGFPLGKSRGSELHFGNVISEE